MVLAAYGALTLLLTYPLPLRLSSSARDWGDPFLVSWIMGWQLDKWASLDLSGYFDANIFYPHLDTLAYSEFFVPQAVVGAPLYYLTGNALLTHNVVMLLALTTSAWCCYLLVSHLTHSRAAGFIAGLIFGFNPFMFAHLSHLQVLSAAGIPLAFLWLHRYFESGELRYMLLFTATYVAQALGNAYYAVYLTYAAGAFIAYRALAERRLLRPRFWGHMALHAVVSVVVLAPFYSEYIRLRSTMGFRRGIAAVSGHPFLAAPDVNRLYGPWTSELASPEAQLFPGLTTLLLALGGLGWLLWESSRTRRATTASRRSALGYRILGWLGFTAALLIAAIAIYGGFRARTLGVRWSATSFTNPALILLACLVARFLLRCREPTLRRVMADAFDSRLYYVALFLGAALLSLGAPGPYRLLYEYAPGFDAIRAVPRIHVLTMFAAAVLAGVALQRLQAHRAWLARPAAVAGIALLIGIEYLSVPLPLYDPGPAPAVDAWLSEQEGDFAVAHYPIMRLREPWRMYRSLTHHKLIVNGFSGYPAPVYVALRERQFDFVRSVEELRQLGVRYLILDRSYYRDEGVDIGPQLRRLEGELRRVEEFGDLVVYELPSPWTTRQELHDRLAERRREVRALPRQGWRVRVSTAEETAELVLDGDRQTRWRARRQLPGVSIAVDLGAPAIVAGVSLAVGEWANEVPAGLRVDVSDDGVDWRTVWRGADYEIPVTEFLRPLDVRMEARFDPVVTRHVRVVVVESRGRRGWTVVEFDVLAPDP